MIFKEAFNSNEYSVNVSTEKLIAKTREIENICGDILVQIKEVETCINSLPGYWDTVSSSLLQDLFEQDKKEADGIEFMLKAQIDKLDLIISRYSDTEKVNIKDIEMLPEGIIS